MDSTQYVATNKSHGDSVPVIDPLLVELRIAIAQGLRPNLRRIDVDGEYPRTFMHQVGNLGGFKQGTPTHYGGTGKGIHGTIQVIEEIAKECLNTGFIVWCQTVCAWYIQNGESNYLKEQVLPRIITGEILAGTGLSNPMKHFAGIEKLRITAERCADGYILNGIIPWVSNINENHYFAVVAQIADEASYLMCVVPGNLAGLSLGNGGHFIALEGSSTRSCRFKDAFVPNEYVLASPCSELIRKIQPGFILAQTGFGLGLAASCVELIKRTNETKRHINSFLDDQVEDIEADLSNARQYIYALADEIGCGDSSVRPDIIKDVVRARILATELSLRASQAAMLHSGASGYLLHCTFERKLRESYFVAIVTPALKHLKKVLHDLEHTKEID